MKKVLLALALIATVQVADAQVKTVAAAQSAAEAAQKAADNPKQATKFATWLKLGQAYIDAYNAPAGNGWVGATVQDVALVQNKQKPQTSQVELEGQVFQKDSYPTVDYYFGQTGYLMIIDITKPIYEDALDRAFEAYKKAYALDTKKSKVKDVTEALKSISGKFIDEAYNAYTFGDLKKANLLFEKATIVSETEPYSVIDTSSYYNIALTSYMLGDNERAEKFFNKCKDLGYYAEGGDVYVKLADIATKAGDAQKGKAILEEGFVNFPQGQGLLIGLINYYISAGEDTGRLFELIDKAISNEPQNASLYYVKGNIYNQLGQKDEALASYRESVKVNPDYVFGYYGEGVLFYDKALELQDKAQNEFDNAKYEALLKEFEVALKSTIAPFKKAFDITDDPDVKMACAEYLKNACYRFRDESEEFKADYDKYSGILANGL